jgi:hypothetical protein
MVQEPICRPQILPKLSIFRPKYTAAYSKDHILCDQSNSLEEREGWGKWQVWKTGEMHGKPEGKRRLGRHRLRWWIILKCIFSRDGMGCMDWIGVARGRGRLRTLVKGVVNLRVP